VLDNTVDALRYGASLAVFDAYIVNGQRTLMETCWLPAQDTKSIDVFIEAMETAVSPGCAVFTHQFKGAASRVPQEATAFGLRRDHVLVEILATFVDRSLEAERHQRWARAALAAFDAMALPGGYSINLACPRRLLAGFWQAFERLGWVEGRNVPVDYRYAPAGAGAQVRAKERRDVQTAAQEFGLRLVLSDVFSARLCVCRRTCGSLRALLSFYDHPFSLVHCTPVQSAFVRNWPGAARSRGASDSTCGPSIACNPYMLTVKHQG
jgi:hypothetical protein